MIFKDIENAERDYALVTPALIEVIGAVDLSFERLRGGRNSRVYHVVSSTGEAYVAKLFCSDSCRREREFAALRFLWRNGVRSIPEPIATFPERALSILRLVDGAPVPAAKVSERCVDLLVEFLVRLDSLKHRAVEQELPDASEACYSLAAICECIRRRITRLRVASEESESAPNLALRSFLGDGLAPALERASALAAHRFHEHGIEPETELALEDRTLSPSDFGFHNALRRPDGSLVFLDFEHFGWDDPAKMVSDFLLHPAAPISQALLRRFRRGIDCNHPASTFLRWRVPIVYPLYAIKWCSILLNEFVSEHRARRGFAAPESRDPDLVLFLQLAKAKCMLETAPLAQEQPIYGT